MMNKYEIRYSCHVDGSEETFLETFEGPKKEFEEYVDELIHQKCCFNLYLVDVIEMLDP